MSRGPEGEGFNSDRADVWDGSEWSFATWGDFTLSEPRHFMGSAVIEITLGEVIRLPERCRVMMKILILEPKPASVIVRSMILSVILILIVILSLSLSLMLILILMLTLNLK